MQWSCRLANKAGMKKARLLVLTLCLLTLSQGWGAAQSVTTDKVKGKWSGEVGASIGIGFSLPDPKVEEMIDTLVRYSGSINGKISYERPRFSASLRASASTNNTDQEMFRYISDKSGRESQRLKRSESITGVYDVRFDLGWSTRSGSKFTAFASYLNDHTKADNLVMTVRNEDEYLVGSREEPKALTRTYTVGFNSFLPIRKGRNIQLNAQYQYVSDVEETDWITAKGKDTYQTRIFRMTPNLSGSTTTARLFYVDSTFTEKHHLLLEGGTRFSLAWNSDYFSGATQQSDGSWKDSLRVREHFLHLAPTLEPYVRVEYRPARLYLYAEAGVQMFGRLIQNDTLKAPMKIEPPAPVGRFGADWKLNPKHTLSLTSSATVVRPTYLQTCWYERMGEFENQWILGNPDLKPTTTLSAQLIWRFVENGFYMNLSSAASYRKNGVVRTFVNLEYEGRDYTIFYWINAAKNTQLNEMLVLGWQGKDLAVQFSTRYNWTKEVDIANDMTSCNYYWEWIAKVNWKPGNGWSLSTDGSYRTAVTSLYGFYDPHYVLNARISKQFKHCNVYLDGTELLDYPMVSGVASADKTDYWIELSRYNRRIIRLGFTYLF